jgi:uroporphyrinogen-III synthase
MRVLVTRSIEDAERTSRRLAAKGHEALVAPVTEIIPTADPRPEGSFDVLIVTSAHAKEALVSLPDKDCLVFAVGPHTASAVRQAGFSSILVAEGDAVSLVALIRDSLEPDRTLLHVTGRHHKEEPAASLNASGFSVRHWEAYEARAVGNLPTQAVEALRTGQIDAALHYSRRSAEIFLRLAAAADLTSFLRPFPHLCLSADVAAPFEGLGVTIVSAARPHEDFLLALLDGLP